MKKYLSVLLLMVVFGTSQLYSYPKENPGCSSCHDGTPHIYQENMISVKSNPLSFEINVKNLNRDLNFMMGAEIVDSAGKVLAWVNHTINLPIKFDVHNQGKYLVYIGGSFNGMSLRYDSMYVETTIDSTPPKISSVFTHDGIADKVYLKFDEQINPVTSGQIYNFKLEGEGDPEILSANVLSDNQSVILEVEQLIDDELYTVRATSIEDRFGNIANANLKNFVYKDVDPYLKAYWAFDEDSGQTVIDYSNNGNNGFVEKAFRTSGVRWTGLDVRFKQRFVEIENDESLNLDGDFTVSFWFYPEYPSRNYARTIISARDSWNTMDWQIFQTKAGSLDFWFGNNGKNKLFQDNLIIAEYGKWNHVLVTREDNTFSIWLNGENKNSKMNTDSIPTGDNIYLGRLAGDSDDMWGECLIDEVRIYGRTLEQNEILELYDFDMITHIDDEIESSLGIFIYPNPAIDYIEIKNLTLTSPLPVRNFELEIYDVLGRRHTPSINTSGHPSLEGNYRLNVSHLLPGIYFVQVGDEFLRFVKI